MRAFHSPVQLVEIPSGQETPYILMEKDVHLKFFNFSGHDMDCMGTEQGEDVNC